MGTRIRTHRVTLTAVEVADYSPMREAITFIVGSAAANARVMVRDGEELATLTRGVPVSAAGGEVSFFGLAARRRWTARTLDPIVSTVNRLAVIEEFPDNYAGHEPDAGVPT